MDNKGAELSLNTIIIVILVLIVLVVLVIAFKTQIAELFSSFNNLIRGVSDTTSAVDVGSIVK